MVQSSGDERVVAILQNKFKLRKRRILSKRLLALCRPYLFRQETETDEGEGGYFLSPFLLCLLKQPLKSLRQKHARMRTKLPSLTCVYEALIHHFVQIQSLKDT